jgi:hypothetical protein
VTPDPARYGAICPTCYGLGVDTSGVAEGQAGGLALCACNQWGQPDPDPGRDLGPMVDRWVAEPAGWWADGLLDLFAGIGDGAWALAAGAGGPVDEMGTRRPDASWSWWPT